MTTHYIIGLAMLDGFMYAIGGWDGTSRLDSVERYNPKTNTWTFIPPIKIPLTSPAVIALEGFLYVTGKQFFLIIALDHSGVHSLFFMPHSKFFLLY